ncbi:MAG: hypothetical protein AAF651_03555 [Cyanobacteria bacterium P01_C01_bin.73]
MTQILRFETMQFRTLTAWLVANFIGGCIIGYLESNGLQFMATLILSGAIAGSAQWVVLKCLDYRGRRWSLWPLVSCVGWIAGVMLSLSLSEPIAYIKDGLIQNLGLWNIFGLNVVNRTLWITVMAIAQGTIFSISMQSRAQVIGVWLLASWVGAALHGAIATALCSAYCQVLPPSLMGIIEGGGWAAYGVVTGLALVRFRQQGDEQL